MNQKLNTKLLKTSPLNLLQDINPNCTFGPKILYMAEVYFSLGSNENDRLNALVKATRQIDILIGKVKINSSVIESEPWGFKAETSFYNMVLLVETQFTPHQVLNKVLEIEKSMGRVRHGKEYSSRIIDIDILFFDKQQINDDNLVIPHPLLHERLFVLQPLAEIAPEFIHPVLLTSVAKLLLLLKESGTIPTVVSQKEFATLLNI